MSGTTSLGTYLRDLRARRGLSLDEVARLTRVASRYIEALEADTFGALPAPVFTRGYIRAYCQALHEPVEEALALYHSQSVRTPSVPTQPVKVAAPPPSAETEARSRSTVLVSFILLVVLGLALFGVTLALQSGKDTTEKRTVDTTSSPSLSPSSTPAIAEPPSPPVREPAAAPPPVITPRVVSPPPVATVHTAPPAVASVHATPPTSVPSASPATPPSAPAAPPAQPATPDLSGVVAAVTSPYHLVARVSEPTWIRVRTEDGRLSEETIPAGQVREWVSNGPFVLTIGNALYTELEETLIAADLGAPLAADFVNRAREEVMFGTVTRAEQLRPLFRKFLNEILAPAVQPLDLDRRPAVILMLGVNGSGKTTTCAKLAAQLRGDGKQVLLAAADTFRAAAIEQLETWGARIGVDVIRQAAGSDPAAVVFDALKAATARNVDTLIIDTAGRLHTKSNLMAELAKLKKVIERQLPGAPHESLMVLDAPTGQNGFAQARMFHETIGVSGVILTKLDGTAKGGIVVRIVRELKLPIKLVGVGEKVEDLGSFDAERFVDALVPAA